MSNQFSVLEARSNNLIELRKKKFENIMKEEKRKLIRRRLNISNSYIIDVNKLELRPEVVNRQYSDNIVEYIDYIKRDLRSIVIDEVKYGLYNLHNLVSSESKMLTRTCEIVSSELIIFLYELLDQNLYIDDVIVNEVLIIIINTTAHLDSSSLVELYGTRVYMNIYKKIISKYISYEIELKNKNDVDLLEKNEFYMELTIKVLNILSNIGSESIKMVENIYNTDLYDVINYLHINKKNESMEKELLMLYANFTKYKSIIKQKDLLKILIFILEIKPNKENILEILWSLHFLCKLENSEEIILPKIHNESFRIEEYIDLCYEINENDKNKVLLKNYVYPLSHIIASLSSLENVTNIFNRYEYKLCNFIYDSLNDNFLYEIYYILIKILSNISLDSIVCKEIIVNMDFIDKMFVILNKNKTSRYHETEEVLYFFGGLINTSYINMNIYENKVKMNDIYSVLYNSKFMFMLCNYIKSIVEVESNIKNDILYLIIELLYNFFLIGETLNTNSNLLFIQFLEFDGREIVNSIKINCNDKIISSISRICLIFKNYL